MDPKRLLKYKFYINELSKEPGFIKTLDAHERREVLLALDEHIKALSKEWSDTLGQYLAEHPDENIQQAKAHFAGFVEAHELRIRRFRDVKDNIQKIIDTDLQSKLPK
jgi:hypothetical protein